MRPIFPRNPCANSRSRAVALCMPFPRWTALSIEDVAVRLGRAQTLVERGEIDPKEFAPRNRHHSPYALLERLRCEPSQTLSSAGGAEPILSQQ